MTDISFPVPPAVLKGETADIYFLRSRDVLDREGVNPRATMEVFPSGAGILCGMREALDLLREALPSNAEVWALEEGQPFVRKEVVLRFTAPYLSYAIYETAVLGYLAQESGWATAARECVEAAGEIPVVSFGARHVHPAVAAHMDYAAVVGGCASGSTSEGARLASVTPSGTMPHAMILCFGDTVAAAVAFDKHMPPDVPRMVLVDTFRDEPQESVAVAQALGQRLSGVRLDTPGERGGVTADLVKEVRAHLDLNGFPWVRIFVSGGVTPDRIRQVREAAAPVDGFGVGSYITSAHPIDFTGDLKVIEGKPVAKRGRIPGITESPRLKRVL